MDEYFAKCSINPVRLNPQRKNNRVIGNLRYARNKREIAALRPLLSLVFSLWFSRAESNKI